MSGDATSTALAAIQEMIAGLMQRVDRFEIATLEPVPPTHLVGNHVGDSSPLPFATPPGAPAAPMPPVAPFILADHPEVTRLVATQIPVPTTTVIGDTMLADQEARFKAKINVEEGITKGLWFESTPSSYPQCSPFELGQTQHPMVAQMHAPQPYSHPFQPIGQVVPPPPDLNLIDFDGPHGPSIFMMSCGATSPEPVTLVADSSFSQPSLGPSPLCNGSNPVIPRPFILKPDPVPSRPFSLIPKRSYGKPFTLVTNSSSSQPSLGPSPLCNGSSPVIPRPFALYPDPIPPTLHQKVNFIHDKHTIPVEASSDTFPLAEPVLEIKHSESDLQLSGFIFDQVQTLNFVAPKRDYMPYASHGNLVVSEIMRDMRFMPGLGLGRRQHGVPEFVMAVEADPPFGLGYVPKEEDFIRLTNIRRDRALAKRIGMIFDYPIRPIQGSILDYFVRPKGYALPMQDSKPSFDIVTGEILPGFEIFFSHLDISSRKGVSSYEFDTGNGSLQVLSDHVSPCLENESVVSGAKSDSTSDFLCFPCGPNDIPLLFDECIEVIEFMDGVLTPDEYQDQIDDMDLIQQPFTGAVDGGA